jgi:hypothetical protein
MRKLLGILTVLAVMLAGAAAIMVHAPVGQMAQSGAAPVTLKGAIIAVDYLSFAMGFAAGATIMWIYRWRSLPRTLLGIAAAAAAVMMLY